MKTKNLLYIIILNIMGAALFLSWYLPESHGFWFEIDKSIFYFFNNLLVKNKAFMYLIGVTNMRVFDSVAFLCMVLVFYYLYRKQDAAGRRRIFCIGLTMIITAVLTKYFMMKLPVVRSSPAMFFDNVNLVSVLTGLPAKDRAGDCFPGDHAVMLLIFCAYTLKYFSKKIFAIAVLIFVVFSMPRIMGGAHWFTDIAVGSVASALIILSWILLTPFADKVIGFLEKRLPLRYFSK
ncbi:MAG: hypothetical protein DBY32_02995 [Phascolarctobacterium sp.]|nr:MAG: hypothetical protein DBY32_02995 [Phascolarctobacterium sp.]